VIVSHAIVLFDFIEERHEQGEALREALLDAGISRLGPVLITVGATVFGLFPLAAGWRLRHSLRFCWCRCCMRYACWICG
jgi:multidrug efflux pump subunit AcrB